jgi:hypothetical protein
MRRKRALVAGLAVLLLLVGVALAYALWLCPACGHRMTAYYTCANHVPSYPYIYPAYMPDPPAQPPPPRRMPCPECKNLCDADSVVCDSCGWSWHR